MNDYAISWGGLAWGYLLLIFPLAVMLWYRVPLIGQSSLAVLRMTVQLLLVGLYLQVVFRINNPWLNVAWLLVMIVVADASVIRGSRLKLRRFAIPVLVALCLGTAIPLLFFEGLILDHPHLLDARYVIPLGGMILGNCLRADIIGLSSFYESIRKTEKVYLQSLAESATLAEATRPYLRDACELALRPTVATMATIGLVALPGMMTGVILGGTDPMTAIMYQLAIMLAIFAGTAITVAIAILLTIRRGFTPFGILDRGIFIDEGC